MDVSGYSATEIFQISEIKQGEAEVAVKWKYKFAVSFILSDMFRASICHASGEIG
jgi:hypothetical protein